MGRMTLAMLLTAATIGFGALATAQAEKPERAGSGAPCEPGDVCTYQTTSTFGSATVGEMVGSATPIAACPDAASAYAAVGRDVTGFFGPCPDADQIAQVKEPNNIELRGRRLALAELGDRMGGERLRRANLNCPPGCYGTPDPDDIQGDSSGNTIAGAGSGDYLRGGAGQDTVQGEDGADLVFVNTGNLEVGRGGNSSSDSVVVWADTGKDYAYGGKGTDDNCYVDGTDVIDATCEWNNLTGGS